MEKFKKPLMIVEYIIGILLIICSFQMFADGGIAIAGGILMIVSGLICIPASRAFFEKKMKKPFGKMPKYAIILFGWLSIAIFGKNPADAAKKEVAIIPKTETIVAPAQQSIAPGTAAIAPVVAEPVSNSVVEAPAPDTTAVTDNSYAETAVVDVPEAKKTKFEKSGYGVSNTSGTSGYTVGPRGGCYYINSRGKKVYVDHSYCN